MRSFLEMFFVIVLGLAIGGGLSWYSIQNNHGFGALKIRQWTAWPLAGSINSDPYTKAKVAAESDVPLGAAEGIAFHARTDENGDPLKLNCRYVLQGQTPAARLWTLNVHRLDGTPLHQPGERTSAIVSRLLLRADDGRFSIFAGPKLTGGNWLETRGNGAYQLILRLYDSPITSTSGIVDPEMPSISFLGCDS